MDVVAPRFDDIPAGAALQFPEASRIIEASTVTDVRPALAEVDAVTRHGAWAYGFVSYEAAPGLDPSLAVHGRRPTDPPLVWFAVTAAPARVPALGWPMRRGRYRTADWVLDCSEAQFRDAIGRVRDCIAAGLTYQLNLTTHMLAPFEGDPAAFYLDLALRQRPAQAALITTGRHTVVSASPELFFRWSAGRVLTRPMKGTAARGRTLGEDGVARRRLLDSAKEQAENVIVVDLLRNDLARIGEPGTVRVEALGRAERYETVWQLTSDISAELHPDVLLPDVFAALFPCGSVTGAPKSSTTGLIRMLEPRPRGLYCGAIGWVAPPDTPTRARFGVAIRTAVIDHEAGHVTYGVGGGITWNSAPTAEWAELHAKARILDPGQPAADFRLIETMAYRPTGGIRNRALHLARLADSAQYFGFAFARRAVDDALDDTLADAANDKSGRRVRLTLGRAGDVEIELGALPPHPDRLVTLSVDSDPIDSAQVWLFHKTTRRRIYTGRAARHASDDVVLVNEHGRVTEATTANLAVHLDGRWWTPPATDGLLPGIERGRLLDLHVLKERPITPSDLVRADALALVNSLRGWRDARLQD